MSNKETCVGCGNPAMRNSREYTKQEHFNRIKRVIENSKNNIIHLPAIDRMVENFRIQFGECKLANSLSNLKRKLNEAHI